MFIIACILFFVGALITMMALVEWTSGYGGESNIFYSIITSLGIFMLVGSVGHIIEPGTVLTSCLAIAGIIVGGYCVVGPISDLNKPNPAPAFHESWINGMFAFGGTMMFGTSIANLFPGLLS